MNKKEYDTYKSILKTPYSTVPHDETNGNLTDVTVSFIVICKNEDRCIARCIDSIINHADEIVVIDTGSTDSTIDILNSYGHKLTLHHFAWCDDFSKVRNFGISKVSCDWIFIIDADEWISEEKIHIRPFLNFLSSYSGKEPVVFSPKILNGNGSYSWSVGRIFRSNLGIRYKGIIHEEPVNEYGKVLRNTAIDFNISHDGYDDVVLIDKCKGERNLRLLEEAITIEPNEIRWKFFYLRDKLNFSLDTNVGDIVDLMVELMDEVYSNFDLETYCNYGYFRELYKCVARYYFLGGKYDVLFSVTERFSSILSGSSDFFYYMSLVKISIAKSNFRNELKNELNEAIKIREGFGYDDPFSLDPNGYHIDEIICDCLEYLDGGDLYFKYRENLRKLL